MVSTAPAVSNLTMGISFRETARMRATITSAVLFVCSAISIVWLVLTLPVDNRFAPLVALACALVFLVATCVTCPPFLVHG